MKWRESQAHLKIPYRSIFAVLTVDSILIYDTYHSSPLCIVRGLHYAGLTDCSWSSDGHHLVVSSTDGYISTISFERGELGDVYQNQAEGQDLKVENGTDAKVHDLKSLITAEGNRSSIKSQLASRASLPPCEPGQTAVIVGPPAKKARTMTNTKDVRRKEQKMVTPILLANSTKVTSVEGREPGGCKAEKEVVGAVTNLSLNHSMQ